MRAAHTFRAHHVGSLLRPPELLEARDAHAAGRLDDAGLAQAEDEAIRDVVRMRRIEEASQQVDVEQLCLSPQCGISSTVEGNALSREQQAAKPQLIVETAKEVWG